MIQQDDERTVWTGKTLRQWLAEDDDLVYAWGGGMRQIIATPWPAMIVRTQRTLRNRCGVYG